MIILESGFGNFHEAFLERRLKSGVNIIFSDDNNKGKTLLIQGMMYSIGNDPIFPDGFDYRTHYFYSKIRVDEKIWLFLRKNNSFLIKSDDDLFSAESVSEFKRVIDARVFKIPAYMKDGRVKLADPALLYQIFFLPQDNRGTSTVIGGGYFNKQDFYDVLSALSGEVDAGVPPLDVEQIEGEVRRLEEELRAQRKFQSFARKNPRISEVANSNSDRQRYSELKKNIEVIQGRISGSRKKRIKESSLKAKLESLIGELRSLNRELTSGKVYCCDCGSSKISFKNSEYTFDVTNDYVRGTVIRSIEEEIDLKQDIIEELTREINRDQELVERQLQDLPKDILTLMFQHEDVLKDAKAGRIADAIERELDEKKKQLDLERSKRASRKNSEKGLVRRITDEMQKIYREMDPDGLIEFPDIFAKRGTVYSGSEGMEYFFSRMVAIKNVINHEFPIVIDSFRDGELSSNKERFAIDSFQGLNCQVIVTSTLKENEYSADIYSKFDGVNPIDYSSNKTSHILTDAHASDFSKVIRSFGVIEEI